MSLRRAVSARRSSMPWVWSAWSWVNSTASTWSIPEAVSWRRSSGGVSIRSRRPRVSISAPQRVRRSRGSWEVQVRQRQPDLRHTERGPGAEQHQAQRQISSTLIRLVVPETSNGIAGGHHDAVAGLRVAAFQDLLAHDLEHRVVAWRRGRRAPGPHPTPAPAGGTSRNGRSRRGSAPAAGTRRHRARVNPLLVKRDDERRVEHAGHRRRAAARWRPRSRRSGAARTRRRSSPPPEPGRSDFANDAVHRLHRLERDTRPRPFRPRASPRRCRRGWRWRRR